MILLLRSMWDYKCRIIWCSKLNAEVEDQWKCRKIGHWNLVTNEKAEKCEGGAKVKFCQTKMETQSCKYGFLLLVHLWCFYVSKGVIYLKITLGRQLIVSGIIGCSVYCCSHAKKKTCGGEGAKVSNVLCREKNLLVLHVNIISRGAT